jgi:DNA polymerase III subunit delta'
LFCHFDFDNLDIVSNIRASSFEYLSVIVGHQKQLQFLKRAALDNKLSHAYLFCGPAKVGKKTAALELISEIFSLDVGVSRAHPDFVYIKADEESKNIKIGQVRDLISRLSLKPASAPLKAAVIDQAHLMTADSQNCLLKTLEEPSGKTLLILVAESWRLMLPTIVSRCETVKFGFVPQGEVEKLVETGFESGLAAADRKEIAALSFGRPGRAIDFISNAGDLESWRKEIGDFSRVIACGLGERFDYVKKISEEKDLSQILEIWLFYFRSLMLKALEEKNGTAIQRADGEKKIPYEFALIKPKQHSLAKIANTINNIQRINRLLAVTNVNAKLALETLMLDI